MSDAKGMELRKMNWKNVVPIRRSKSLYQEILIANFLRRNPDGKVYVAKPNGETEIRKND